MTTLYVTAIIVSGLSGKERDKKLLRSCVYADFSRGNIVDVITMIQSYTV